MTTLAGGALLAIVPATVLVISGKLYSLQQQGYVAVAVTVALFTAQFAAAAIVESRLSSPRGSRRVKHPAWLLILALAAGAGIVVTGSNIIAVCIGLPLLLASLEVGRGVAIAERLDRRELVASISVGVGALAGVGLAFLHVPWAMTPLVVAILVATLARTWGVGGSPGSLEGNALKWILIDVAFVGAVFPVLNALILAHLGASSAVVFAAVSTISGLVGIPLGYLRMRLLKEHSPFDILLSSSTVLFAVLAIFAADFLHVFGIFFGAAWTGSATLLPLVLACGWRAASLWSTIPFAGLRRLGLVRRLTLLRVASVIFTFGLAVGAVELGSVAFVFGSLLAGEILQATLYEAHHRKATRQHFDEIHTEKNT
ncbi:MAG: hypothetical protein JJE28_00285 [Actinomycetales bacterium]|nr:hypothetical protein [Actinomycetales bacterium]